MAAPRGVHLQATAAHCQATVSQAHGSDALAEENSVQKPTHSSTSFSSSFTTGVENCRRHTTKMTTGSPFLCTLNKLAAACTHIHKQAPAESAKAAVDLHAHLEQHILLLILDNGVEVLAHNDGNTAVSWLIGDGGRLVLSLCGAIQDGCSELAQGLLAAGSKHMCSRGQQGVRIL